MSEVRISPPHSVLFVSDPTIAADIPSIGDGLVGATATCIVVGTLAEMDGETLVKLAERVEQPLGKLVFDGELETPGRRLSVTCSDATSVSEITLQAPRTRVRIWANDPSEPDVITIVAF